MPYTPSTLAQTMATSAGTNQAALASPQTALQTSISGGNLAPAAFMDGILAGLASNTYIEIGSGGAPAFTNSWTNFGSPYNTAAFFKDACGIVHMKGLIKSGSVGAIAFTLPAGYRPPGRGVFAVLANAGSSDQIGRLDIYATGEVVPFSGGNTYFAIECSFLATQ